MYLLGYIPKDNRLYLGDKELNIVSYSLLVSVLEYQTAVMRRDFSMADKVLPTIPKEQRTRVAHFLEKQVRGWGLFVCFVCVFENQQFERMLIQIWRTLFLNCHWFPYGSGISLVNLSHLLHSSSSFLIALHILFKCWRWLLVFPFCRLLFRSINIFISMLHFSLS